MIHDERDGTNGIQIRNASEHDIPVILSLIRGLAEYERLADEMVATESLLRESLFGAQPQAEVIIAWSKDEPAGFALFFHNYSTFLARRGIYLEDLFVRPEWRGRGIGKLLLRRLAALVLERNGGRLEWAVLNWNEPAIRFYRSLDARAMDEWTVFRVTGEALSSLASGERPLSEAPREPRST